ncbi:MAG: DUF423 domain-containing protein [Planctomycetota bacterium]|jgi:uncharacterized membrane protein YgdD (TMEM256/DUF423 family)
MWPIWLAMGAISGLLSVAAGAFAAHGLKRSLSAEDLAVFETAARYQMYHALALIAVAWVASRAPSTSIQIAGWCFVIGTILFSGSLYALTLGGLRVGLITPIGGAAFLLGWALLAYAALTLR